ncbi:unnamed protein product, partial [Polarella glacialis]
LRSQPSSLSFLAAMASPARLNTAQSEGNLSNMSRGGMSETRKAKLMDLKKREDLKDALVDKFKVRFGHGGAGKSSDEMSVCSETIANEVNRFARSATITEANLMRLEGRLQGRAQGQLPKIGEDNQSMISGVS